MSVDTMAAPLDETALERDGARAANQGASWQSNPYLRRENMPAATGESVHDWSRKHDAWQRGFEGHAHNAAEPRDGLDPA